MMFNVFFGATFTRFGPGRVQFSESKKHKIGHKIINISQKIFIF